MKISVRYVPTAELPPDEELGKEKPSERIVNSVARLGILRPIVLQRDEEKYQVLAGGLLIKAARMTGLEEIPARIWIGQPYAAIAADQIAPRVRNVVSDYHLIRGLLESGHQAHDIAAQLDCGVARVLGIARLQNLIEPLAAAWLGSRLNVGFAALLASLPTDQQYSALSMMADGEITIDDISQLKAEARRGSHLPLATEIKVVGRSAEFQFRGCGGVWIGEVDTFDLLSLLQSRGMVVGGTNE